MCPSCEYRCKLTLLTLLTFLTFLLCSLDKFTPPTSPRTISQGNTGESRREEVERLRLEKLREEEEALTFKPKVNNKSPKKCASAGVPLHHPHHPREAYVDKELTFTPKISDMGKQMGQDRARRISREKVHQHKPHVHVEVVASTFTPEITKLAKQLPSDDKLKGGPRLYEKSRSRELERQSSAPLRTKEDEECTFTPVNISLVCLCLPGCLHASLPAKLV